MKFRVYRKDALSIIIEAEQMMAGPDGALALGSRLCGELAEFKVLFAAGQWEYATVVEDAK